MSSYKLTYFNARGRAEVIRMLFVKAGVEYEDKRISGEEWATLKEGTPFRQLPTLEVDGMVLCQSIAISLFLAKRFGLHGSTELEEARIDAICLAMEDLLKPLERLYHEPSPDAKAAMRDKYAKEELPRFLKCLQKIQQENKEGKGTFVGNSITVADIYFTHYTTMPATCEIAVKWDDYPELKAVKDNVESDPKIAEWLQNRPNTQH